MSMTHPVSERYEIGKRYQVPTVRIGTLSLPILGPLHDDQEIIGFPHEHWHVDPRFMSDRLVSRFTGMSLAPLPDDVTPVAYLLGLPVSVRCLKTGWLCQHTTGLLYNPMPTVVWRRRICYREMPLWDRKRSFDARLQAAYAEAHIADLERPVCPHRGIPLWGLVEKDGVVECPGHGLRWNLNTGRLATKA